MKYLFRIFCVFAFVLLDVTPASAATIVKVTWETSEISGGETMALSKLVKSNSKGKKSWKKTGDCALTRTKFKMGSGVSCTLTLTIGKFGKYPSKTFRKKISNPDAYAGAKLKVGDSGPGGGVVFYVGSFTSVGSSCKKSCSYLEVAPVQNPQPWCNTYTNVNTSGIADEEKEVGTGMSNTVAIAALCESGAAKSILGQLIGTKSDWFLPSMYEIGILGSNSRTLTSYAGFMAWTSTQYYLDDAKKAWSAYLGFLQQPTDKSDPQAVVPIRAF
jgi:hypothetical protein